MTNWVQSYLTQNEDLAALPVAHRSRYSLHLRRGRRERLALVSSAPIHFYDSAARAWLPLDTRLQPLANGLFGAPGLPFSLSVDGDVSLEASRYCHKTIGFGIFADGLYKEVTSFKEGKLEGNRLIREAGAFRHETILHPRGLREELILQEAPRINAPEGALFVIESILPSGSFKRGLLPAASKNGVRLPAPWAYGAETRTFRRSAQPSRNSIACPSFGHATTPTTSTKTTTGTTSTTRRGGSKTLPPAAKAIPVLRWVEEKDGHQVMYTGVPFDWLAAANYPVTIDPDLDITGDTADGHIEGNTVATSTTHSSGGATMNVGGQNISGATFLWRGYLKFNTSSLGPEATVTQANLQMVVADSIADVSWTIYVRQYDWSANDPMASGTREAAWDGLLAAANAAVLTTSAVSSGPVTSADLPEEWIEIEGNTYYGLWCDQEGFTFPTNEGAMHAYATADHATPENRPLLMLEYFAGYPTGGPLPLIARFPSPQPTLIDTRIKLRARKRRTLMTARMKDE